MAQFTINVDKPKKDINKEAIQNINRTGNVNGNSNGVSTSSKAQVTVSKPKMTPKNTVNFSETLVDIKPTVQLGSSKPSRPTSDIAETDTGNSAPTVSTANEKKSLVGNDNPLSSNWATQYGYRSDKIQSTEKLLKGEESKGYVMPEEIRNSFGVVLDKTTGQKADAQYVDALVQDLNTRGETLSKSFTDLNNAYQNGMIDANEYTKQYQSLEKQRDSYNKSLEEYNNYEYIGGSKYYDWLKQNGTAEEVEDFENYVSSYDDSVLESLANSYKATLTDWLASNVEPFEMVSALIRGDEEYLQSNDRISTQLRNVSQELQSYTLNGKNDQGVRKYALQTVSSLMPMINDAIIGTITFGAMGLSGTALNTAVSAYTNIQMGLGSAGQTMRQRLEEGNTVETAFWNGVAHGSITGLVEALNVGNVANVTGFLTGTAGQSVLGVGLLSLPKFTNMAMNAIGDAKGEAFEEWAEVASDYYADRIMNNLFFKDDQVKVGESPWSKETYGNLGDGGLTDQMIMAGLGAVLMGVPTNVAVTIDSASKYKAGGEAIKFWEDVREQAMRLNDTDSVQKAQATIDLLANERQTYKAKSVTADAVEIVGEEVGSAPSVEDVLNITANAFRPDVNDQIQNYNNTKQNIDSMRNQLQESLDRRGYSDKISLDTYLKAPAEVRENSKKLMDFANETGAKVLISDEFDYKENGKVRHRLFNENETGVTVNGDTIVINPFAKEYVTGNSDAMVTTFAHELTHSTEATGKYKELEQSVRNAMRDDWQKDYDQIVTQWGDRVKTNGVVDEGKVNREIVARYIENNIANEQFLDELANRNSSAFAKMYYDLKAMLKNNPQSKVARNFFKAYDEKISRAMESVSYTNVFGDLISAYNCQFNVAQYTEKGRDVLQNYLDKQVKKGDIKEQDAKNIIDTLDYYKGQIEEITKNPDKVFENFSNWSNVSMTTDHEGYPQLTCVVANGEYKMNIDFSTVCKKRKIADAVFNELAKQGILDGRALTQQEIATIRQIVKDNELEVACSLCFVDSKRFNQGGWADTLVNGKTDKKKAKLVRLGVQDAETKHIMGWNEMVDMLANDPSEIGTFNFANRPTYKEGTLHTLSDEQVNQKGLAFLKKIEKNMSIQSEVGRMARVLLHNPECRKHMLLGDLYASVAFGNIKRGNQDLFKLINTHQGVAKPKSPYVEVTYNNEIISSATFDADKAREVGGVRLQSFSDFMTNMVFDYMEAVAEMQAKGLTAHSYTKVKDYAELFGLTGIKINLSIIPKATTMSTKEFLNLSENEQAEVKKYAGLERFSIEDIDALDPKEKQKLIDERGLGLSEDGSCYTAYIFEDESFNWLDALELSNRDGYDKNVGTICVGVSAEHIWKMMADNNVQQIIPYHKSSLNSIVAHMMNIGAYNDFTDVQNTRVLLKNKQGEMVWTSVTTAKVEDFGFYTQGMLTNGYDAKDSSNKYLLWCAEKGYLPKFDEFAYISDPNGDWRQNENGSYSYVGKGNGNLTPNENYYKVLIDFRAYDKNGNIAPQESVAQSYPTDFKEKLVSALTSYEDNLNSQKALMPKIVDEVKSELAQGESDALQFNMSGDESLNRMRQSADPEVQERVKELDKRRSDAENLLLEENLPMSEVFRRTGWMQKPDGKWRFQFYDGAEETIMELSSFLYDNSKEHNGSTTEVTFPDLFVNKGDKVYSSNDFNIKDFISGNNIIYTMYPDLESTKVRFVLDFNDPKSGGEFDLDDNIIRINLLKYSKEGIKQKFDSADVNSMVFHMEAKEDLDVSDTFFHELQHFIQDQEGFESGSNMEIARFEAKRRIENEKEEIVERQNAIRNELIGTDGIDENNFDYVYFDYTHGGRNYTPEQLALLKEHVRLDYEYNSKVVTDAMVGAEYLKNLGETEAREEAWNATRLSKEEQEEQVKRRTNIPAYSLEDVSLLSDEAREKFFNSESNELQFNVSDDVPPVHVDGEVVDGYGDERTQRFASSNIPKSGIFNNAQQAQVEQEVKDGLFTYLGLSNQVEVQRAREYMSRDGVDATFNSFMQNNRPDVKSVVQGEVLVQELAKNNDPRWHDVAVKLADDATMAGQFLQAYAIMQRLSPEGQLMAIRRNMNRMQQQLDNKFGNDAPHLEVNKELEQALLEAPPEKREEVAQRIREDLENQVPKTVRDWINSWRYLAMLGNPRTHVRNFVGNGIFVPAVTLKNIIGTGLENIFIREGNKSKAILNRFSESDQALIKLGEQAYEEYKGAIEKSQMKYEKKDFPDKGLGKLLNWLSSKNSWLLDKSDFLFAKARYASSYAQYLKANGMTANSLNPEMTAKANAYATREALRATYRDANAVADWLNELETSNKKGLRMASYVKDAIMPFTKTPMNIVKRGVRYSPVGLLYTVVHDANELQKGLIDANDFLDNLAQGLTGTSVALLGAWLRSLGLFRTKDDDKDRKQYFDSENGEQDYAIDLSPLGVEGTYTIDWATPVIMPFAIGSELWDVFKDFEGVDGFESALDAVADISAKIMDPVMETSMLSSLQDALKSYSTSGGAWLGEMVMSMASSYILQMFPTIGGQLARTIDDTRRTTYPNDGKLDKLKRQIYNKIPWIGQAIGSDSKWLNNPNQPYINRHGQEEKTEDLGMGALGRAFLNMVSPGYYSSKGIDSYDEEMYRLYDSTGELDAFPSGSSSSVTFDKNTFKFSDEEYTEWHKKRWQTEELYVNQFIDSQAYQGLSDEEKVKTISDIRGYAQKVAKRQFLESKGYTFVDSKEEYEERSAKGEKVVYDKELVNATGATDNGIELYAYYDYLNNGGSKQAEKMAYLESSGLTDAQKEFLWGMSDYKTSYKDYKNGSSNKKNSSSSGKKKSSSKAKKKATTKTVSKGSSVSSSKTKVSGTSGTKLNIVGKQNNDGFNNYLRAYSSVFNSSKAKGSAGSSTVTCPKCHNRIPVGASRCPICGTKLV